MTTRPLRVSFIAVGNGILGLVGMLWAIVAGIVALVTWMGSYEPRILADACYPIGFGVLWAALRFTAAVAQVVAGGGLYAMRGWSRPLAIGVACFWLLALLISAAATPVSLWSILFSSNHIWVLVAIALGLQLLSRGLWSAFTLWTLLDRDVAEAFEPHDEAQAFAWRPITMPPVQLGEVMATIVEAPPSVGGPASAVQFLVSGPHLPPWQSTGERYRHREWKIAALVGMAALGLMLIALSTAFQSPGAKTFFACATLAGGLFCLGSVWFERKRFFESRRARGMRWWFGEEGARRYYTGMGAVLVLMSYAMSASGVMGGLIFLALMPAGPKVAERDLPGEFDFYLPAMGDPLERWKSTKSETAPVPSGVSVVQPEASWQGAGVPVLVATPDYSLLLLQDQQPLRLWRQGKEASQMLDQKTLAGTHVCYGVSAGGKQVVALQQYWHSQPKLRRLIVRADDPGKSSELVWQNIETPGQGWFVEHLKSAAVSDDGQTTVGADNHQHVFVWLAGSEQPRRLDLKATDDARLALSPDGTLLLIGERSGQVRLIELATERELYKAAVQGEAVEVAFAPNGRLFCSLHVFRTRNAAQVWELDNGGKVQHRHTFGNYSAHPMAEFSPDSRRIALGGNHADMIQIHDLVSGKEVIRLVHRDGVHATGLAFSCDGRTLVADGFQMMQWQLPGDNADRE